LGNYPIIVQLYVRWRGAVSFHGLSVQVQRANNTAGVSRGGLGAVVMRVIDGCSEALLVTALLGELCLVLANVLARTTSTIPFCGLTKRHD
jgi:hypothetical protein